MDYRIISIGTLSVHDLWEKPMPARTAHATTTLVESEGRFILVDPSLPPQVITARLAERAGLEPSDITDVFLTNFRPAHRWGLAAFEHANWFISEAERESIGPLLVQKLSQESDPDMANHLRNDVALLKQCRSAPDRLAPQVDLFPLPGFTPGTCGLLLSDVQRTTLITGDAVATVEHLRAGRVLRGAGDIEQAQQSFVEAIEIADVIIPGHDNLALNPVRRF